MLIDTDVLIWHLRGNARAEGVIERGATKAISVVTYMEIAQGLRNKEEARRWQSLLANFDISVLQIEERVSSKAMFWMDEFALSHGLEIPDALIAATAETHGLVLLTGNSSDYRFLPGLTIKPFKP
ncbi:MAG: type II toxin-antitoxin system VapC family toxin [Candidatus Omnitrophica bacterium]|nr:type II toxin-antitoxin system VapC family toxin [Candidatus Omnitrophota bacterium]